MKTITIEGAIITDSVLEQIKDWQEHENLNMDIRTLEKAIDLVLAQEEVTSRHSPNASTYLNLIKDLRDLSKNLQKFEVKKREI